MEYIIGAIIIVLLVALVLSVVLMLVLGYYFEIGPLKFLYSLRCLKIEGNSKKYDCINIEPLKDSKLKEKHICFIGKEFSLGVATNGESFCECVSIRNKCYYTKLANKKYDIVSQGKNTYLNLVKNALAYHTIDAFVFELDRNSLSKKVYQNAMKENMESSFNKDSVIGLYEDMFKYIAINSKAKIIVFYTPKQKIEKKPVLEQKFCDLCLKYQVVLLGHSEIDNIELSEEKKQLYFTKNGSFTKAGYLEFFTPEIEKCLNFVFE